MTHINENDDYTFRTLANGDVVRVTDRNTRITYTITRERRLWRFTITYTRVRMLRTARARVSYAAYNSRLARFGRGVRPFMHKLLYDYGITITKA